VPPLAAFAGRLPVGRQANRVTDYSWVIALVLGAIVFVASALLIYDWRYHAFKADVTNAVLGLSAYSAAFFGLSVLHMKHAVWLCAPIAYALIAVFSREYKAANTAFSLCLLIASIGMVAVQNLVDAYHLQSYQWPIAFGAAIAFFIVSWIIGQARKFFAKPLTD